MTQEELEDIVLKMLLKSNDEIFIGLNRQLEFAKVISREFSGYGFFTKFLIPDELTIHNINGRICDVLGTFEDHPDETYMFILFINNGRIDTLEGVSFFDWNNDYDKLQVMYAFDDKRDYDLK